MKWLQRFMQERLMLHCFMNPPLMLIMDYVSPGRLLLLKPQLYLRHKNIPIVKIIFVRILGKYPVEHDPISLR